MAFYMLYHSTSKQDELGTLDELRKQFQEIYKDHDVDILGFWEVEGDRSKVYYMTRYENEDDYKAKVEKLKSDERYQRLTKKLKEVRVSSEATKLTPMWVPE
jgi:transcription antitermination factor NusA-like protein